MILSRFFNAILILCFLFISFYSADSKEFNSYIIKYSDNADIEAYIEQLSKQNINHTKAFVLDLNNAKTKNDKLFSDVTKQLVDNIELFYVISKDDINNSIIKEQIDNKIIEHIEPNHVYQVENDNLTPPNDPRYKEQWALKVLGAEKSWEKATGEGIVVGVIDTGIDYLHDDLVNQLYINSAEDLNKNGILDPWPSDVFRGGISGDFNGIDDDGNGYVDDVIGYDFVDQSITNLGDYRSHDGEPFDEMGHGTQVAGIIAAEKNNSKGIVGLAYNSKIMAIRAFDFTGNAEADDIANSIVYAALNGADVINMSFGESANSIIVESAVKLAASMGCVLVASAGNSGWDKPHYPSDYDEVLSVGTIYENKDRDNQSNWGDRLDLMAPGTGVLTTTFFNDYKSVGGTSFAAPYAAATAALLLEKNNDLKLKEVFGILQQTSEDMAPGGWNPKIGAGLLNSERAVNYAGKTRVDIDFPPNDYMHSNLDGDKLDVTGTIAVPFFSDYQLFIGEGISPQEWKELTNVRSEQIIDDTLTTINLKFYTKEMYTLRLLVNLNNNRELEKRVRVYLPQNSEPIRIISLNTLNIWHNEKKRIAVGIKTNREVLAEVRYRPKNSSDDWRYVSDNFYYEHFHTILINAQIEPEVEMEAVATVKTLNGQSVEKEFSFTLNSEALPISGFKRKEYSLPLSYLLNQVEDLYGDGKPTIAVNNISGASWNTTDIYQFSDSEFIKRDSSNSIWIPAGMGDSNGDGIMELLASANRKTKLTQSVHQGGSPLTKVLFSDTTSAKFWAADFYDLDGDGLKDIIGYNDTAFFAVSYKNGLYSLLAIADMDGYSAVGSYPGSAIGDFDNDGKIELIHSNQKSHLFAWEYSNGKFELETMDSSETSAYTPIYMTKCDIDGDGTPEILMANFGTTETMGQHEGGTPIWLCRVIKYDESEFNTLWKTNAWGVKSGTTMSGLSFRNGVAAGDIDREPGDEIIFSPFPNYYVFKWDKQEEKMNPMWWYPNAYSNSALIYDFDGNGINEMGFTTSGGTFFYEYQKISLHQIHRLTLMAGL
jgi:subtilisin family serine protease